MFEDLVKTAIWFSGAFAQTILSKFNTLLRHFLDGSVESIRFCEPESSQTEWAHDVQAKMSQRLECESMRVSDAAGCPNCTDVGARSHRGNQRTL